MNVSDEVMSLMMTLVADSLGSILILGMLGSHLILGLSPGASIREALCLFWAVRCPDASGLGMNPGASIPLDSLVIVAVRDQVSLDHGLAAVTLALGSRPGP